MKRANPADACSPSTPFPGKSRNFPRGQYDGLVYRDNALYYSDWSKDKKPEAVRRLDLKTGRSAPVATGPVEGAADFILYDSMMVVPGMTEKKIHIMPIGGKK